MMTRAARTFAPVGAALAALAFAPPAATERPPKPRARPVRLFDGRTLRGWEGDTARTWRVERGAIVGGSLRAEVPQNDFLASEKEYGDFVLRLKVKLTGTGFVNAGIQVRSQRLQDPAHEMAGYQADMGEGYWGSLYDESRRNRTLAGPTPELVRRVLKPGAWNDYVILCDGPRVRLWLNGALTTDYTEADPDIPRTGRVALQIHGGGRAEASYKDVTLEPLPQPRSGAADPARPHERGGG